MQSKKKMGKKPNLCPTPKSQVKRQSVFMKKIVFKRTKIMREVEERIKKEEEMKIRAKEECAKCQHAITCDKCLFRKYKT